MNTFSCVIIFLFTKNVNFIKLSALKEKNFKVWKNDLTTVPVFLLWLCLVCDGGGLEGFGREQSPELLYR